MSNIQFIYKKDDRRTAKDLYDAFHNSLPMLVIVTQGFHGNRDETTFSFGQILRLHSVRTQPRVLIHDPEGKTLTIPLSYPLLFTADKGKDEMSLSDIVRKHRFPVKVKFADPRVHLDFPGSYHLRNAGKQKSLRLVGLHDEVYFLANTVLPDSGSVLKTVVPLPLYLTEVKFSSVSEVHGQVDLYSLLRQQDQQLSEVDFNLDYSDKEIIQLSEKPLVLSENIYTDIDTNVYINVRQGRELSIPDSTNASCVPISVTPISPSSNANSHGFANNEYDLPAASTSNNASSRGLTNEYNQLFAKPSNNATSRGLTNEYDVPAPSTSNNASSRGLTNEYNQLFAKPSNNATSRGLTNEYDLPAASTSNNASSRGFNNIEYDLPIPPAETVPPPRPPKGIRTPKPANETSPSASPGLPPKPPHRCSVIMEEGQRTQPTADLNHLYQNEREAFDKQPIGTRVGKDPPIDFNSYKITDPGSKMQSVNTTQKPKPPVPGKPDIGKPIVVPELQQKLAKQRIQIEQSTSESGTKAPELSDVTPTTMPPAPPSVSTFAPVSVPAATADPCHRSQFLAHIYTNEQEMARVTPMTKITVQETVIEKPQAKLPSPTMQRADPQQPTQTPLSPVAPVSLSSHTQVLPDLEEMTISQVGTLLEQLGLEKYQGVFKEQRVDGIILRHFDNDTLREDFGLTRSEAIRLRTYVEKGHIPR